MEVCFTFSVKSSKVPGKAGHDGHPVKASSLPQGLFTTWGDCVLGLRTQTAKQMRRSPRKGFLYRAARPHVRAPSGPVQTQRYLATSGITQRHPRTVSQARGSPCSPSLAPPPLRLFLTSASGSPPQKGHCEFCPIFLKIKTLYPPPKKKKKILFLSS